MAIRAARSRRWWKSPGGKLGSLRRNVLGLALAASAMSVAVAAAPATAEAAYSIGPLTFIGGKKPLQVPTSSLLAYSFSIQRGGSSRGWGGGGNAPKSASEMVITKVFDSTSAALHEAVDTGVHFKTVTISFKKSGGEAPSQEDAYCMTDAFITSAQVGGNAASFENAPEEQISIAYNQLKTVIGGGAQACAGGHTPPVASSLLGLRGSSLLARVDCLSAHCGGIFTVNLPPSACPRGAALCSFTGGVRVGLNGNGKIQFNGDGTATLNGGDRVGLNGDGRFAMGDGSVKVLRLAVPSSLRKWLAANPHALLGAIIVVRGSSTAIVEHDVLDAPAKLPAGDPAETLEPPTPAGGPTPGGGPTDLQQSLSLTSCATPVVGTPTVVAVKGSLAPARAGASVTLTYTPTSGPKPLPAPVIDTVTTDAAGEFSENFNREQGGLPYSWNLVAGIPEGGGYAAAQSAGCAIPIP